MEAHDAGVVRVVQISDTHLSHRRADTVPNVTAVLDWIAADPPDLVVHTGDITAEDPDDEEEAAFAHRLMTATGLPLAVLPGNHDVGGFSADLFDATRLARFRSRWGADTFVQDLGAWRLVGANVYRLGDAAHDEPLASALSTGRPIALFIHQPLCLVRPDQPDEGDWSLPDAPRRRLLDLIDGRPVRLVASGHLHRYRTAVLPGAITSIWCPAASFIGTVRPDASTYRIGAVEHLLAPDGTARHRFVEPPGVTMLRAADLVGWWR